MFGIGSCDDKIGGVSNTVDENLQNSVDNNKSSAVIEKPTVVNGRVLFLNDESYMQFTKNIDTKILQKEGTVINGFKSYYQVLHNIGANPALREENEKDTLHLYYKFTPPNISAVLNEKKELQIGDSITRFDDDYAFIYPKNEENTIDNTIQEFYSLVDSKSISLEKSIFYKGIKIAKIIRKKGSCSSQNSSNAREQVRVRSNCDGAAQDSWLREHWEPAKRMTGDIFFYFCNNYLSIDLYSISEFGPRNWFGGRIWRNRVIPSMSITYNIRCGYTTSPYPSLPTIQSISGTFSESNVSYISRNIFSRSGPSFGVGVLTMRFSGTDDAAGTLTFSIPVEEWEFY